MGIRFRRSLGCILQQLPHVRFRRYQSALRVPSTDVFGDTSVMRRSRDEFLAANASESNTNKLLVACYTPDGAAVCLGRLVGDPHMEQGTVVDLERVLVSRPRGPVPLRRDCRCRYRR